MKKLKLIGIVLFAVLMSTLNTATAKILSSVTDTEIKWTTIEKSISELKSTNKKFILVDLYTDWCGWCKKMDENTFQDGNTVSLMNESFTCVKMNAETPEPVSFNNKTYLFTKTGSRGANKLALDLGSINGKLGYPTLVILDENGNKLQAFPGYKDEILQLCPTVALFTK